MALGITNRLILSYAAVAVLAAAVLAIILTITQWTVRSIAAPLLRRKSSAVL
jgi:hypothetical protein